MSARETARLWIVAGIVPPEMGRDGEEDGDGGEERNGMWIRLIVFVSNGHHVCIVETKFGQNT